MVYRAQDAQGQIVALKLLLAHRAQNEQSRRRFQGEVNALARLRHPNVVAILAAGEHERCPWLALEYVEGETLEARLRRGPLPIHEAIRVAQQLVQALSYVHSCGILHRDLKPGNVLLRGSQALLTDFGLALDADDSKSRITATGVFLGTPGYWAPEQARGKTGQFGPQTDVYGLGAVLYACLTGGPPVRAGSLQEHLQSVRFTTTQPPKRVRAEVPGWLSELCMRCLAFAPAARPGSADDVARALVLAGSGSSVVAPRAGWRVWLVGFVAVLLVGGGLTWIARRGDAPAGLATTAPRVDLALRDLQALRGDPQAGPDWQREHGLYPFMGNGTGALPWQVAAGLEVAPSLAPRKVVIAVLLGLADRFADADRFLGEGGEALALRAELRVQAFRYEDAQRILEGAPNSLVVQRERAQLCATVDDLSGALAAARKLPMDSPLRAGIEDEVRVRSLSDPERRLRELQGQLESPTRPACAFRLHFARAQTLFDLHRYPELDKELAIMKELRSDSPLIPHMRYQRANATRDYPEITRALEEGLACQREPTQRAILSWLRVQSLWLSDELELSRAAREELIEGGLPPDGALQLAAQICLVVEAPGDAVVIAKAGWASAELEPQARWACLQLLVDGHRAMGAWAELRALIESLVGEPLPNDLQQKLADAHAEATTRELENR